ncbi:MAG: pitrilysin family protein [Candidatus Komeilibacteria bacterium]
MYRKIIRPDGSVIILAPKQDTKAVTVQVMYKVGSRQETAALSGSSHFVEHLMFKGTKKRPSTLAISKELDSVGAQFNAFTSKDRTAYYIKADSGHLPLATVMLADMLRHSVFDPAEVKKERGVILEEMKMYEDNPLMYIEDVYESLLFKGSVLGREIIGTRQTIGSGITRDQLYDYKKRWYYPGNMIVGVAGAFTEAKALALINKFFPLERGKKNKANIRPIHLTQTKPRVSIVNKETEQVQIALGFPGLRSQHPQLPALSLMASILGGNMSSRLFINIREKRGLCYFVRAGAETYEDVGSFHVRAGLDKSRLLPALGLIKKELQRLVDSPVAVEELRRAKEYIKGTTILNLEDQGNYLYFLQSQELLHSRIETMDQKLAKIQAVSREDIRRLARSIIRWPKSNLAIIGPYKSPHDFINLLTS